MSEDKEIYFHQQWIGLLQPVGLVVSPPALVKAGASIDRDLSIEWQSIFKELIQFS